MVKSNVTRAREWARPYKEGVEFHFPSGMVARVRPVNMDTFIAHGGIPDGLTPIVSKLVNGEAFNPAKMTAEEFLDVCKLQDQFCKTCFIEPRVVDVVQNEDEEITPAQINDIDKQTLFGYMGAPASALAAFRPFQIDPVGDLVSEQGDPQSAQRDTGHQGVGVGDHLVKTGG